MINKVVKASRDKDVYVINNKVRIFFYYNLKAYTFLQNKNKDLIKKLTI